MISVNVSNTTRRGGWNDTWTCGLHNKKRQAKWLPILYISCKIHTLACFVCFMYLYHVLPWRVSMDRLSCSVGFVCILCAIFELHFSCIMQQSSWNGFALWFDDNNSSYGKINFMERHYNFVAKISVHFTLKRNMSSI